MFARTNQDVGGEHQPVRAAELIHRVPSEGSRQLQRPARPAPRRAGAAGCPGDEDPVEERSARRGAPRRRGGGRRSRRGAPAHRGGAPGSEGHLSGGAGGSARQRAAGADSLLLTGDPLLRPRGGRPVGAPDRRGRRVRAGGRLFQPGSAHITRFILGTKVLI